MAADPARLYQQLLNTGLQNKDNPLYQLLRALIDASLSQSREFRSLPSIPVIPDDISGLDFLTHSNEAAELPNSRNLIAGTNVAFDDSIPNERTVSAAGSGGSPSTASYLTKNNEVLNLPNSIQVLAGAGITFDDTVPNQRTISAAIPATAGAHVYRNSTLVVTASVLTVIPFTNELIDDDSYWNIAQPTRFTIPETGWYAINGQIELAGTSAGQLTAAIRLNGTTDIAIQDNFYSAVTLAGQVTVLIYLQAGDYVELTALLLTSAGTENVLSGIYRTFLQISNLTAGGGGGSSQYYEWDVLTNGDAVNPEVIFAGGEVIMIRMP